MKKFAKVKKLNWRLGIYKGVKGTLKNYIGRIGMINKLCSNEKDILLNFSKDVFYFRPCDLIMANTKKELECNCLLKIYDNEKGYYVKCIYCEKRSKYFKDVKDALKLKKENIKKREAK